MNAPDSEQPTPAELLLALPGGERMHQANKSFLPERWVALGFGETGSPSRCCRSPAVSSMTSHAALCTSLSSSGKWGDRMFPLGLFHMKTFNLYVLLQATCTRLHR